MQVREITFDGARATGVVAVVDGRSVRIEGRQVIVSCGALHSPTLLMRSGIGDAEQLGAAGVQVRKHLPGVGRNLQDHPTVGIAAFLTAKGRLPKTLRRHLLLAARYSSGYRGCPKGDMYILVANQVAWHSVGRRFGAVLAWVNKSYSRGMVRLNPDNPGGEPDVYLNMLSDERDLERLVLAVRFIAGLYEQPELASVTRDPFAASYSKRESQLSRKTVANGFIAAIASGLMDVSAFARRLVIRNMVAPDGELSKLLADDDRVREWVRKNVTHGWHASGTCRMGRPDDPDAVLDCECRVLGFQGLRVVDASVMPSIVSANTNLTTMMIAEKIADRICNEERQDAQLAAK